MKIKLIYLLTLLPLLTYGQSGITFKIEDLSKPERALFLTHPNQIYQNLILSDARLNKYDIKKNNIDFPFNIIANSQVPDSLVTFGYHSFFNGMYNAYADHRPFVLSPDMIWLLISQGFARHVNNNPEQLRKYFVDFTGKTTLIVINDSINLDNPHSPWEKVFPEFTTQIGKRIGKELMDALTCDFSTSTEITKVASEITIMEAMKPYFEFIVMRIVCGIPEITLEGTTGDWQKVLDKTDYLRKYEMDWWIDEITPILKEFIKASKGNPDESFWINMFKYHSEKEYGAPKIIDGWIVKFFPYDKDGKKNNLNEIIYRDNLPSEITKVDLKYIVTNGIESEEIPLELWAGFIGLKQDTKTFALKPQIGWMIRKKDIDNKALIEKFKLDNSETRGGIKMRVSTIPRELFTLKQIKNLEIQFTGEIIIPDTISRLKIDFLKMSGSISESEIERICRLLSDTKLIINDKKYNTR
jgi:hypothetical protein